jgi:uncharacterized repeat protein (TIGR03803 family)
MAPLPPVEPMAPVRSSQSTPAGAFTIVHTFAYSDGGAPYSGLIEATDGNLYGTTTTGGSYQYYGTIFMITPAGTLTTLHSFGLNDGAYPWGGLLQGTNGILYGMTNAGGTSNLGTVFSLSVGLGPFVRTLSATGKVGETIEILDMNFAGVGGVTFNGVAGSFTVVSPSLITATVPPGATTGKVQVATSNGTLSSNAPFRVIP